MRPGPRTLALLALTCWILLVTPQRLTAQQPGALPANCDASAFSLSPVRSWTARVEPDAVHCLAVPLVPGATLRAVVAMAARPPLTGVRALLFAPGADEPAVVAQLGNDDRRALTVRAERAGTFHIVIRDAWTIDGSVTGGVPVRAWIEQIEPPALAEARRAAQASDPRVAWLREHAHPLRTIDASDDAGDADLEPLRALLDGVRIVMLGESDHYAGSDLAARARIVRFLHRELGFDVLALEAGMFGMDAADAALRQGAEPRAAFALGAWPFWSHAEQMQPLIDYLGAAAAGPRPLTLAGFDTQFIRPGAAETFPAELAAFLAAHGIASPLADPESDVFGVLTALAMLDYRTGAQPRPEAPTRAAFLAALDDVIARVSDAGAADVQRWTQVLRSLRAEAELNFVRAEGHDLWRASRIRNAAMAENLIWLATVRFPDRRIIAWAGSAHLMRLPEIAPAAGEGPSMGVAVHERFGDASFVIAATSFEGPGFAADQHPLPDFETLMAEAGFHAALVDVRGAARQASWLGGPFRARAVLQAPEERVWSDVLDALLFIRVREPTRPAR